MTKKKIIGLCIGAVVLAVAAAGVKEGSWLMKHRRMQNEFTHEMNAFTTKTNAELIQPTIVAEGDIYGCFNSVPYTGNSAAGRYLLWAECS